MEIGVSVATLDSPAAAHDEACDPDYQKQHEQHLCDGRGGTGETTESQGGGNECNDEEYKGPMEHGFMGLVLPFPFSQIGYQVPATPLPG
jgi:hypothetical protein